MLLRFFPLFFYSVFLYFSLILLLLLLLMIIILIKKCSYTIFLIKKCVIFLFYLGAVWIHSTFTFCAFSFPFFFFSWAACFDFSSVNSVSVHCSRFHKFHFSAIFSLKMSPTILFTHLKIILLQYFQFSVAAK